MTTNILRKPQEIANEMTTLQAFSKYICNPHINLAYIYFCCIAGHRRPTQLQIRYKVLINDIFYINKLFELTIYPFL